MKNLTISLDEDTAAWVRVYAAQQGRSVSRLVGEMLQERRRAASDYEQAMRRFLARGPFTFEWLDRQRPGREELHDRPRLR